MVRHVVHSESNCVRSAMFCLAGVRKPSRLLYRNKKTKRFSSEFAVGCFVMLIISCCAISMLYVVDNSMNGDSSPLSLHEQQWHRNFFEKPQQSLHSDTMKRTATRHIELDSNVTSLFGCLTEQCIETIASSIARAFPMRDKKSSWCHTTPGNDKKEDSGRGILLIKVPKGASSTSAGVAIRIAARHSCTEVQWRHRWASALTSFHPEESFVFTTVRDPAARAISSIFFHIVSRTNVTATDAFMIRQLNTHTHPHFGAISKGQGGFQLRYISFDAIPEYSAWTPDRPEEVLNPQQVVNHVRQAIQSYDFIIVPERMDESLVAMALLLNIDVGDVLVSSSKVAGTTQYHLLHPNQTTYTCMTTARSFISPLVAKHLQSNQWRAMNYGDYLLHAVASKSLNLTIHHTIGYERFQRELNRYHTLQELELKHCAPHVQFPCSNDGIPQLKVARSNCYLFYYDFGCGYPCIDRIINEHDNGPS